MLPKSYKAVEERVKYLSVRYYNDSLEFVRDNKLTPALDCLKKSVCYDKTNIEAQNLLGLVYYRLGRITDAYIHWSISAKYDSNPDNKAVRYLQDMLNSVDYAEKCKAVSKYNESLHHARQGNYDMAVMRLKRGLDFNSKSVDILNLLAFCYMMQGNNKNAYKYVEKVLKIDKSNRIAKNYRNIIKPEGLTIFKKEEADSTYNKSAANASNKSKGGKNSLVYMITGAALMAVICFALVMPTVFRGYEKQLGEYETNYNVLKNKTNEELAKKNESIKTLSEENESLKSKLNTAGSQDLQARVKTLAEIESNFKAGNVDVAADSLVALNSTGFTGEVLEQYRKLCKTVLVTAAENYFAQGQDAQSDNDYDSAKEFYNKCLKCSQDGGEIGYSAMYELGKIAVDEGDNEAATRYFTTVAEKHPVESIKNEAATFLNEYYDS